MPYIRPENIKISPGAQGFITSFYRDYVTKQEYENISDVGKPVLSLCQDYDYEIESDGRNKKTLLWLGAYDPGQINEGFILFCNEFSISLFADRTGEVEIQFDGKDLFI